MKMGVCSKINNNYELYAYDNTETNILKFTCADSSCQSGILFSFFLFISPSLSFVSFSFNTITGCSSSTLTEGCNYGDAFSYAVSKELPYYTEDSQILSMPLFFLYINSNILQPLLLILFAKHQQ